MKNLLALVALVCCVVSCCASKPADTPRAALAEVAITLHVDTDFAPTGRVIIEKAADNIRRLTNGRAQISLAYDLDFQAVGNLEAHNALHHSQVIAVNADFDIVRTIDAKTAGRGTTLAVTVPTKYGSTSVILILDRIAAERFEFVVTHEFGHVIGLPDLEEDGAIMTGVQSNPPADWTFADVELCRKMRYCD